MQKQLDTANLTVNSYKNQVGDLEKSLDTAKPLQTLWPWSTNENISGMSGGEKAVQSSRCLLSLTKS